MKITPMSPHRTDNIPSGEEWVHQLKWDGYRAISVIESNRITLYSKSMNDMTLHYPEIVKALAKLPFRGIADGELVMMNPKTMRPDFQMLQNRNKHKTSAPVQYIVFDVLMVDDEDLRQTGFLNRHQRLKTMSEHFNAPLFTTDVWEDGEALWKWVRENGWEGVVSKRKDSFYREGKKHRDWYKKHKTSLLIEADVVGFLFREGRLASLVLSREGRDFGRVSLGLTQSIKTQLSQLPIRKITTLHQERKEHIHWLQSPLSAQVIGTEMTNQGLLRHPRLYMLEGVLL